MKMKIIEDIRVYKSESKNEYGTYITSSFADKNLNAIIHRIVMKLRENEFQLGEFDHLYVNFTICDMNEKMELSNEVDRYHPWYRHCSVYIGRNLYDKLGSPETYDDIIQWISNVLITFFVSKDFDDIRILSCIHQAIEQGENMLMKYKEKTSAKRRAVVYLRYLDRCIYYPLVHVYDMEDNLLFEKNLPETLTLESLGEIQVSTKRITIKSRKNAFATHNNSPLIIEY